MMADPRPRRVLGLLALAGAAACSGSGVRPGPLGLAIPERIAHAPRECAYDVERYAIDLDLDPATRGIQATCRIRFWARGEPVQEIDLDLEDLEVATVVDELGRDLSFVQVPGTLRVSLGRSVAPGDCAEVAVRYSGRPRKGLHFAAERAGVATQVFTQGECEDSRGWFPCFDSPSDRATTEIRVSMPASWTAVAAGDRIERLVTGDRATELWRMTTPHPAYLTTLVAGEFVTERDTWDGIPILYLAEESLAGEIRPNLGRTGDVLGFLSEITGHRYPYSKYAQSCVSNFPYGGMENISATTLTDTALIDEKARRDGSEIGLVVHEAAHQWFGDLLTCRDWSHVWLNEGFATYCAALFNERDSGLDEFRLQMRDMQDAYLGQDVGTNRRPVIFDVYRWPMDLFFSGHVYGGAAVRLHLLRSVLGDEVFFRGVRLYVGRNAGRAVVTNDLRAAMEEASGMDLAWFFETWFEKPGYPEFEVGWRFDEGRHLLLVSVNQVQKIGDGTPAEFRTPVEIGIFDSNGLRTVTLQVDRRRHLFEIPASERPRFVRFDEHGWIPKRLEERKTGEEWLAIAKDDPDVNGRREAVRVLGRFLEKSAAPDEREGLIEALTRRLDEDSCPAVRQAAAASLSGVREPGARTALSKAARGDAEARVRVAALNALSTWGKDAELAQLALQSYSDGFSWATQAASAQLYAAAHTEGIAEWFRTEIEKESPQDVLRARLIPVLGHAYGRQAIPVLIRLALDEASPEAGRAAAVAELGRVGRGDARALRALISALSSPSWRVRREAITGLVVHRTPSALVVLRERFRETSIVPELRAIQSGLESAARDG